MKYKVSELDGDRLDDAVSKAEGVGTLVDDGAGDFCSFMPSRNWNQGGPIIERERLDVIDMGNAWAAGQSLEGWQITQGWGASFGPTLLVAAMRAFVASKMGEEVELP